MNRTNAPVESITTLLSVVEYLEQAEEAGVTEISNSVGVSKSTVHNHLTTLRESGYVVNEDGRYRLGLRFLRIGETMRMQTDLFEIARPQIEALVEGLDLVGNLSVEEQEKASTCTDPAEATTSDFRRGLARDMTYTVPLPENRFLLTRRRIGSRRSSNRWNWSVTPRTRSPRRGAAGRTRPNP